LSLIQFCRDWAGEVAKEDDVEGIGVGGELYEDVGVKSGLSLTELVRL
jgi:hypothetical protein